MSKIQEEDDAIARAKRRLRADELGIPFELMNAIDSLLWTIRGSTDQYSCFFGNIIEKDVEILKKYKG